MERRLKELIAKHPVDPTVVAPVPWFPLQHKQFGEYAKYAAIPSVEEWNGLWIEHPRYLVLPKISWRFAPLSLYLSGRMMLRRMLREGREFDLIDAHFYFPDGVAAVMLGQEFGLPVVVTARGNDLSLMPSYTMPKRMIQWAIKRVAASVTVCEALKETLVDLGASQGSVHVLRNGVDLEMFQPMNKAEARRRVDVMGHVLISVGHLIERKGNHITIQALQLLPDTTLVLVGDGPEEESLRSMAESLGVSDRVRFVGPVSQAELKWYYSAADALVLVSSREGWANVLLEAMACGTPVIASAVWGTPEVVKAPEAGVLLEERSPQAVAVAAADLLSNLPGTAATREYAEEFGWDETSDGQYRIFCDIARQ